MEDFSHLTDILVSMGFDVYDIERAYISGHKTLESIIDFILGVNVPENDSHRCDRLRLRGAEGPRRTMFSSQPVCVNLSDLRWTSEVETGKLDPVADTFESSPEEPVHSKLPATSVLQRFDFEQRESKKMNEKLRKEKFLEKQERERLLSEVAADREARRQAHSAVISPSHQPVISTAHTNAHEQTESQNRIKVKIILFDRPKVPFVIDLNPSDAYADLLSTVQPLLVANPPDGNIPGAGILHTTDTTLQALNRHLQSLSVTDRCIRMIVHTWPRRELVHPSDIASNPDPVLLTQRLTEMQITNGTIISVRHVNCPFQTKLVERIDALNDLHPRTGQEFIIPVSLPSEDPQPSPPHPQPIAPGPGAEDEDFPMEPVFDDDSVERLQFPGQGQRLHPRPPGNALPISALSVQDNVRRAALSLAERLNTASAVPVPSSQVSESLSWGKVPTLVKLCLNAIRAWITQYTEAFSAARLGLINEVDSRQMVGGRTNASQQSDDAAIHRRHLELWVAHHLSGIRWPDILGQQLIQSLVDEKCFTARTAVLLRNCVSTLDLRHYILTSTELVQCLSDRWTGLVGLYLDSDHPFQVATEGIFALKRLQNLISLSLCGLHSVNDETLPYLLALQKLETLRLSGTKVSDSGWIGGWTADQSSPHSGQRCVIQLELNGMGSLLTDSGLSAIVRLFPRLQSLCIAHSGITGNTPDESILPPPNLMKLDVSGCVQMRSLPKTVLPSPFLKIPSDNYHLPGIRLLAIGRCEQLDLPKVLSQIEGHPICRLDGLFTISSLDSASLRRVFSSGFPFTEVSLTGCNFEWFRSDPSILADILHNLTSTNALTQLSLPLRPVAIAQDKEVQLRICDGLSRLRHCEKLVDLDLGAQIIGQQEFDSLLVALQSLPRLSRLSVTDLPPDTQQALCDACPPHCKIRVHQHRQV